MYYMARQVTRELLEEIVKMLPETKRNMLWKILSGKSTGKIAKEEHVHSSTISKRVSDIHRQFDEVLKKQEIVDSNERPLRLGNKEGNSCNLNESLITLFSRYMPEKVNGAPDEIDEPGESVPSESGFYVERSAAEEKCKHSIVKLGALIRITAPGRTGKTSLMNRVLNYAAHQNFKTISWDLSTLDRQRVNFSDINLFLKCFCQHVVRQLEIENRLAEEWDITLLSFNDACTDYFEKHILSQIPSSQGLVIGLDNLDLLFEYQETSNSFLGLLRSWYSKSTEEWQRVRLLISHSTQDYSTIDVNQSPFNVGTRVSLPEFTKEQVKDLAQRHGLLDAQGILTEEQQQMLKAFWRLAEGHPYLQRLWMYHAAKNPTQWYQIYKLATTDAGIYAQHLQGLWAELNFKPELKMAMKEVIAPSDSSRINPQLKFHLESLGLAKYLGEQLKPYCRLYSDYFSQNLN
jgi:hypothetical protein